MEANTKKEMIVFCFESEYQCFNKQKKKRKRNIFFETVNHHALLIVVKKKKNFFFKKIIQILGILYSKWVKKR